MALVPISDARTKLPDPRGAQVATPVSSGVLGSIADGVNHSVGWRQLRLGHWSVERDHSYANGGTYTEDPGGKTAQTFLFMLTPSVRTKYLQVLVTYQARKLSLTTPRLSVWLETLAGTSVDGSALSAAFTWDYGDGTLSGAESTGRYVSPGVFAKVYPVLHANTGITIDDTPTTPTTPRCLNLTTFAGQSLAMYIKEQDCRLLTVSVKGLYEEMVDQ